MLGLRFQGLDGFGGIDYGGKGGHLPLLVSRFSGTDYHAQTPLQ